MLSSLTLALFSKILRMISPRFAIKLQPGSDVYDTKRVSQQNLWSEYFPAAIACPRIDKTPIVALFFERNGELRDLACICKSFA